MLNIPVREPNNLHLISVAGLEVWQGAKERVIVFLTYLLQGMGMVFFLPHWIGYWAYLVS